MAKQSERQTWNLIILAGCVAALMGVVALVIDQIQGDPFNPTFLSAIGAGLLVTALALRQRQKAPKA